MEYISSDTNIWIDFPRSTRWRFRFGWIARI